MAALLCVTITLAILECILLTGQSNRLFTPVSLFAVVAAALLMTSIAINSGWVAAAHFTLIYMGLSLGLLLLNASLYSLETLFIPILGSLLLLGELIFLLLPARMMLSAF